MTTGNGFRGDTGQAAAPPYTQGPYTFSEDITFESAVTIEGTMIFGDLAADSLTIGGTATVSADNKFYWRDTGLYVYSSTNGQLDIIADVKMQLTAPTIDLEASTGIALDGDVAIDGAHTFATGTGDVTIKGDMSIDAGKDFDMSAGAGTFATGTGAVSLNGDVTIASGMDLGMSGASTFATGTGAVSLNGAVSVASGKSITLADGCIDFTAPTYRAIRMGTKVSAATSLPISTSTFEAEPDNNYLMGLFAAVNTDESASADELRGTWIRTRVNEGCHVGTGAGYGFGVCGAELQLKVYADGAATNMYSWQNSAVWAQLETAGAAGVNFKSGSHSQCILANVGLTSTTTIDSGAVVAGITINTNTASAGVTATGGFYGLHITDITPTHLDFQAGIKIDDSVVTTGIAIGTCTTAGITMAGGASYNPIHIGVKSNVADAGIILAGVTDDTGGVMIFADDGGDALGSVTSPIWTRYLLTTSQSAGATATGAYLQLKNNAATFTSGSYTALKAFYQCGGATTLAGNAELAIINAGISFEGDLTNTLGTLSGVDINVNDDGNSVGTSSGLLVRKTSGSTAGWTYGVNIADSGATTGILIGNCTTGIKIDGTGSAASSKALTTAGWTLNNANLTDGYGAVEVDLTLTGTSAGHTAALSSWVNIESGTASNFVCAQTNGVWETGATISGATVIFGMRMQSLCAQAPGKSYPFSCVSNTNIITAIFQCNAGSSDMGTTAVSKTTEGKYVPLYEDDAGVHYVLIYN